jgi:hypothetical protein
MYIATAKQAFPSAAERALPTCPAQWVELTADGELSRLGDVPDRLQRHVHVSRCKNRLVAREYRQQVAAADHYGAVTQGQRYRDAGDARCGDAYVATPWMQTGEMDLSSYALKKALITRFALDVPLSIRPPRSCTCGACIDLSGAFTKADIEIERETERVWLRHRFTCPSASGLRIATHDQIARLWVALLKAAGFTNDVKAFANLRRLC